MQFRVFGDRLLTRQSKRVAADASKWQDGKIPFPDLQAAISVLFVVMAEFVSAVAIAQPRVVAGSARLEPFAVTLYRRFAKDAP